MIGSFLTRGLVMVFGYAYPAYECYKAIEMNKPEIQQLRFWCQYWILVAALTIFERVGDTFASWVPLYCEAKLAFFIYLWFPKTRGTTYVYDSFFRPYVAKHENEIDRNLVELRTKAGDMAVLYCRKAVSYGQTRFTDILHFVALQSTPKPQLPKEKKQPAPKEEEQKQPDLKTSQAASSTPQASLQGPKPKKPLLLTKEPIAVKPRKQLQPQQQTETKEAQPSVSQTKLTPSPPPSPSPATKPNADSAQPLSTTEANKELEIVAALPASEIQRASSSKEAIMEETIRVTRGSLRKARSTGNTLKEKIEQ
ncbi:HVA22-like protein h [Raphanus sativus]|uniref:HVA22-like protein n=1 Tax=Raphanus sativus TaxID=3726 RepID=A0A9W3DP90_RAPSA|nr:HVA22-like protein h [Raphanus sativus]